MALEPEMPSVGRRGVVPVFRVVALTHVCCGGDESKLGFGGI